MSDRSHAPIKAAPVPKPARKPVLTPARGSVLQRKCGCRSSAEGKCEKCEEQGKTLQRQAANHWGAPSSIPPVVHDVLRSPGRALDPTTRAFMEPRFGQDFSGVRVHDDASAAESARAVDAKAYTVGQHIAFDRGEYQPHTYDGRGLLAHELAHTVQQAGVSSSMQSKLSVGPPGGPAEREADAAAKSVMSGSNASVHLRVGTVGMHRQVKRPGTGPMTLPCGDILTAPEGPRVSGNDAHDVITADFEAQTKDRAVKGLAIPGASSKPFRVGVCDDGSTEVPSDVIGGEGLAGAGKPDLAYYHNKKVEIAEIKIGVSDCLPLAEQQVDNYIEKADENKDWLRKQSKKHKKQITGFLRMPTSRFTPKTPIVVGGEKVAVAWCEPGVIVYKPIDPTRAEWKAIGAASATDPYAIQAGVNQAIIQVPKQTGKPKADKVPLSDSDIPENIAAAETLVPGVILLTLNRKPKGTDTIEACLATQTCSKKKGASGLPIKVAAGKGKLVFNVEKGTGKLSLAKTPPFPFKYDLLSEGTITKLNFDAEKGVSGAGKLKPSLSLLRGVNLGIEFSPDSFAVTTGLDEENLKKVLKPIPYAKVTEAKLGLQLYPEFKPEGHLQMEVVFGKRKILDAGVKITLGTSGGLYAKGTLNAYIPGVDKAEGDVIYDAGQWSAYARLESTKMNLPYVTGGQVEAGFNEKGPYGDGNVDLEIPGGHKARVGLHYRNRTWFFSGKGEFNIKRIGTTVSLIIDYFDGKVLKGKGTVKDFNFKGLTGDITVNYEGKVGAPKPRIWGDGKFDIKKGKVTGSLIVRLLETGNFSGEGGITYEIRPGLVAAAGISIDDQEKVKITGSLTFPPYVLFPQFPKPPKNRIDIFKFPPKKIGVPYMSFGPFGLQARIRAGIFADYSIGPAMIVGGFIKTVIDNPLDENPDVELDVGGKITLPVAFSITGYVSGGLVLDVLIAEAGGEITVSASAILGGEAGANFKAHYGKGKFEAWADVGVLLRLIFTLCFDAYAWASAGVWKFKVTTSKNWHLGHFTYDPGLQLGMKMNKPLHYSSDTGLNTDGVLDSIEWIKPKFDTTNALKSSFDQDSGSEKESKGKAKPCPVIHEEE